MDSALKDSSYLPLSGMKSPSSMISWADSLLSLGLGEQGRDPVGEGRPNPEIL